MPQFIIQPTETNRIFRIVNVDKIDHAKLDLSGEAPKLNIRMSSGDVVNLEGSPAMDFVNNELYLDYQLHSLLNPQQAGEPPTLDDIPL